MRKKQRDVADLGALGIIRESFKLFLIHRKTFLLILLTFILPIVVFVAVGLHFSLSLALDVMRFLRGSEQLRMRTGSGIFKLESIYSSPVLMWIPVFGIVVVAQIAQGLWLSTVFYTVGLIYSGKTVSFPDVVRAAIPRLWLRVTFTYLYIAFITYLYIAIVAIVFFLVITHTGNFLLLMFAYLLVVWTLAVTGIYLAKIFIGAAGVSILEEDYGWAAIAKGYKLMKGKEWVISRFNQISSLPNIIIILFMSFFYYQNILSPIAYSDSTSIWSRGKLLLALTIWIAWTSFYALFHQLGNSVIYVSCKAFNNESIEDSYIFDERPRSDGYEAIDDSQA